MKTWTSLEIEQLTQGFLSGTPLKELARKMDRTPTALNKALTRFGIRRERPKEEKTLWNDFGNAEKLHTLNPMTAIKKFDRRFRKLQNALVNQWVPMEQVLGVLDSNGHRVYMAQAHKDPRESLYALDGRTVTALKIIFLANRYRIAHDQAPFYVAEVTC